MNVQIRPAYPADAEAVSVFLHEHMNSRIAVERWRRVRAAL